MRRVMGLLRLAAVSLLLVALPLAGPVSGKTLRLTDLVVSATSKGLSFYFTLDGGLPEEVAESIQSGIPVTFRYLAELRSRRRLWGDNTISAAEVRREVKCDIIKKDYSLLEDNGGQISKRVTKEFAELEQWLAEVRGLRLAESSQLEEGKRYYARAKGEVESFKPPFPLRYLYSLFSLFRIQGDWEETSSFTVHK